MATVTQAQFSVSWTKSFPSLLASGEGKLVLHNRYVTAFNASGGELSPPWKDEVARGSWNTFWGRYSPSSPKLRLSSVSADTAWGYVVPLQWTRPLAIEGPAGSQAEGVVLVYPAGISVVVTVAANGKWALSKLPAAMAELRAGKDWSLTTPETSSHRRTLDGLARDLQDSALPLIADGQPDSGPETILTVAAPHDGEGDPGAFDVSDKVVGACLAALAGLAPWGTFVQSQLIEQNRDTAQLAARIYEVQRGHVIWHAGAILNPSPKDPIGCLLRNHTMLTVHIAALSDMVKWAVAQRPIPPLLHELIRNARVRLERLHGGHFQTYQSEVAKRRIEPLLQGLEDLKLSIG